MMKKFIVGILAVAIVSMGALFAIAQSTDGGKDKKWGKRGGHKMGKMHRGGGMMFRGLDLTEDQKAQMKSIREASKASTAPLREAMKANRTKLSEATANGAFDEALVTAIANEGSAIQAQMTVQREKVKSQMFSVLTAEQKAKAAEMKATMKQRFEERKGKREAKKAEGGTE
jgi:P pilus assembly/Cpx signaling pathway, periplasmic inhibitor/zinc-resistance associated protein